MRFRPNGKQPKGKPPTRKQAAERNAAAPATKGRPAIVTGALVDEVDGWPATYLQELSEHCQKVRAAQAAGVSHRRVSEYRINNPQFAEAEAAAMGNAKQLLESTAMRIAMDGNTVVLLRTLEWVETGCWRQKQMIEQHSVHHFATRAERKAALEKARTEAAEHRAAATGGGLQAQPATAPALPST